MSAEIFKQPKASEACLSAWRVSLIAAGDEQGATQANRAHLLTCAECAARVQAETQQVRRAQSERLPQELAEHRMRNVVRLPVKQASVAKQRPQARRWQSQWMWGALAPAMAAGIAAVVISLGGAPSDPLGAPSYRLKGGEASLSATVQRGGGIVLDDRPLESMHVLRSGDRLRLRLAGNPGAWVQVQGMEDGHWSTYFQGAPPADRWLPFGIEVTDAGDTRLKLVSCDAVPGDPEHLNKASCAEHTFGL